MFLLLSFVLLVGRFVEGLPVQEATYKGVRCAPGDQSANCKEEGSLFEIAQETNKIVIPSLMKRSLPSWDMAPFSGEESGSGNYDSSESKPDTSSEEADTSSIEDPNIVYRARRDVSSVEEFGSTNEYVDDYSDTTETDDKVERLNEKLLGESTIL